MGYRRRTDCQACSARVVLVAIMLLFHPPLSSAGIHFRSRSHRGATSQSLRKRLHVNSLITEPGTFEVEFANTLSVTSRSDFMPAALKWTPGTGTGIWGRTELNVGFDAVSSVLQPDGRANQFSDHVSFLATSVLYGGAKLNLAIAPEAFFYLRDDRGARLGAVALARYDSGPHSAGMTLSWTGATRSSSSNPAGTFDLGGGYGRKLANAGILSYLTPHLNLVYERSSGGVEGLSVFEGVEYQVTKRLAIDISGQHLNLWGDSVDHQIVLGMTFNLGPPRRWFPGRGSAFRAF